MAELFEQLDFVINEQYETIITDIATKKYSIVEDFFSAEQVATLREELLIKYEAERFKKAAIGNRVNEVVAKSIRDSQNQGSCYIGQGISDVVEEMPIKLLQRLTCILLFHRCNFFKDIGVATKSTLAKNDQAAGQNICAFNGDADRCSFVA